MSPGSLIPFAHAEELVAPTDQLIAPPVLLAFAITAENEARVFVAQHTFEVVDWPTAQDAANVIKDVGRRRNVVVFAFARPKQIADRWHKWICKLEKDVCRHYDELERRLKKAVSAWKVRDDARRAAETAALQVQAKIRHDDRVLDAAVALTAQGRPDLAEAALTQGVSVTPVVCVPDETKLAGLKWVPVWKWTIDGGDTPQNLAALIVGPGPSLVDAVEQLLERVPDPLLLDALGPALAAEKRLVSRDLLCLDRDLVSRIVKAQQAAAPRSLHPAIQVYQEQEPVRAA